MFRKLLAESATFISLSEAQIRALEAHYSLLERWNKKINLTAIRSMEEAVQKHYLESLFLGSFIPESVKKVVDVGSGAGFPGFPVGVLRSGVRVELLESDIRKSAFLKESARGISNIGVLQVRSETVKGDWDGVISRAVRIKDVARLAKGCGAGFVGLLVSENQIDEVRKAYPQAVFHAFPWDSTSFAVSVVVPRGT